MNDSIHHKTHFTRNKQFTSSKMTILTNQLINEGTLMINWVTLKTPTDPTVPPQYPQSTPTVPPQTPQYPHSTPTVTPQYPHRTPTDPTVTPQ